MAEKKSGAKKSSARKSAARKSTGAAKKSSSSAPRKRAAKKAGQARGRQQKAQKQARRTASAATGPASAATEFSGKSVAEFRQALSSNLIKPLELVMLSRERIEEALEEVVKRGRMTRDDAAQLGQALFTVGRQQTDDVLKDLEQLLGRGRSQALQSSDRVLREVDRARRRVGVGAAFPITLYDELNASQIQSRLSDLTPAQLRKVRDYEKRHDNRKSVLSAIEKKLA
jgi:polyhydroxyalkanoate synthesis regulator phasin